ncbi:MAG: hypothetical protein MUD14_07350 [Hydrococcus sp. Prado102]|jgi:hypothetical protein|nr:hypothetical protein [Hydrococcus sp. Prado102]
MSLFNIQTTITPPRPEQGEYGFISLKSDLISISSIISEGYRIAVLVDFQGLENKVIEEISNISDRIIDKELFKKIPYAQIELDEEMLDCHAKDVGKSLENRSGFYPQDGEFIQDEDSWGKYGNFKRYRVHLSEGSHIYLNTNIAFELASCLDAFNTKYQEFQEKYQANVCRFNELEVGDIFFDSICEDCNKSFVKYDRNRAQYLDYNLELISDSFKEFDNKYKLLKSDKKIGINLLFADKKTLNTKWLQFYDFLLGLENNSTYISFFALGLSFGLYLGTNKQLFNLVLPVTLFLIVINAGIVLVRKRIENYLSLI